MDQSPFHCVPSTPYLSCPGLHKHQQSPLAVVPEPFHHAVSLAMPGSISQTETPGRLLVPGTPVVGTSSSDASSILQPNLHRCCYGEMGFRLTPVKQGQSPREGSVAEQIVPATPHQSPIPCQSAVCDSEQKIKQTMLNLKCVLKSSLHPDWTRQLNHSLYPDRARQGNRSLHLDRTRQRNLALPSNRSRQGNLSLSSERPRQRNHRLYLDCQDDDSQPLNELPSTLDLFNGADIFM